MVVDWHFPLPGVARTDGAVRHSVDTDGLWRTYRHRAGVFMVNNGVRRDILNSKTLGPTPCSDSTGFHSAPPPPARLRAFILRDA